MARDSISPRIEQRRRVLHVPHNLGERTADVVTRFAGSWAFVGLHAVWFVGWIALRLEQFPFGLLTMIVSLEAIFLSTFVLISQSRSEAKHVARDDVEAKEVAELYSMMREQCELLRRISDQLNRRP